MIYRVTFLFLLITSCVNAQYKLSGTVRDLEKTTGTPLENVRVDIDSSSYVAMTDTSGHYVINNIPFGVHNVRFSFPGYRGFFKQNYALNSNSVLNVSMPDTVQVGPDSSESWSLDDYMGPNGHGLIQVTSSYPNAFIWRNISEADNNKSYLIPVYLNNATSSDSSVFFQSIGACDGNWHDSPAGSIENKMQRAIYLLSNNSNIGNGSTRGIMVNFNAQTTNTDNIAYEYDSFGNILPYVYSAQVNLGPVSGSNTIDKELFMRSFIRNDVSAGFRLSYANANPVMPTNLDYVLNKVFFNFWGALDRGEQGVNMYDMEDSPVFGVPGSTVLRSPANVSANLDSAVAFSWGNVFGTDSYELQVAKDGNFSNVVVDTSLGRINVSEVLNSNAQYFWRVREKNSEGTSSWSEVYNFTTKRVNHPPYVAQALSDTTLHVRTLSDVVLSSDVNNNIKDVDGNLKSFTATATGGSAVVRNDSLLYLPANYGLWTVTLYATDSANVTISTNCKVDLIEVPDIFSISNPSSGDTAVYTNGNLIVSWDKSAGASGYIMNVSGPGLDSTITNLGGTDTTKSFSSNLFKEMSVYRIDVSAFNSYGDTTKAANSDLTFYAPQITGIDKLPSTLPKEYSLYQNYPNPFNPTSTIRYAIPKAEFVTVKIYNTAGELVATLVNEEKPAGNYSVNFNASKLSSGVYFCRMRAGGFVETKKLLLLK